MNSPFHLHKHNAKNHPLSYLLILCDELQSWDRMPYGKKAMADVYPQSINLSLDNNMFQFEYIYINSGWNGETFAAKKIESIKEVLIIENIFDAFNIK